MSRRFISLTDPELIALLQAGAIGVIPTDTVYGLVACAESEQAIERLYAIKQRKRQPGTTIGASVEQLAKLGFPSAALAIAEPHWPNALSVEMPADSIPKYLSTDQSVMAARIPDRADLVELLTAVGPLMTTSANAPGEPTSTTIHMAEEYFGDAVDFYVDGGDLSGHPPSTIIGIKPDHSIVVYREGAVQL